MIEGPYTGKRISYDNMTPNDHWSQLYVTKNSVDKAKSEGFTSFRHNVTTVHCRSIAEFYSVTNDSVLLKELLYDVIVPITQ